MRLLALALMLEVVAPGYFRPALPEDVRLQAAPNPHADLTISAEPAAGDLYLTSCALVIATRPDTAVRQLSDLTGPGVRLLKLPARTPEGRLAQRWLPDGALLAADALTACRAIAAHQADAAIVPAPAAYATPGIYMVELPREARLNFHATLPHNAPAASALIDHLRSQEGQGWMFDHGFMFFPD